jgi:hypothetical protein
LLFWRNDVLDSKQVRVIKFKLSGKAQLTVSQHVSRKKKECVLSTNDCMIYYTNVYPFSCLTAHYNCQTTKDGDASLLLCYVMCNSNYSFKGSQCLLPHWQAVQKKSAPIYPTTQHIIPHNLHVWQHFCENHKPQMSRTLFKSDMEI